MAVTVVSSVKCYDASNSCKVHIKFVRVLFLSFVFSLVRYFLLALLGSFLFVAAILTVPVFIPSSVAHLIDAYEAISPCRNVGSQ